MFRDSKNNVEIVGYLKDNTLAYDQKNPDVISGYVVVMTDEKDEFRIRYYVNRYKKPKNGAPAEKNRVFDSIEKALDQNTTSLAKIIKMDRNANFDTCKDSITKIRCTAKFQEYLRNNREDKFDPIITLEGKFLNIIISDKFVPSTNFDVEVYIDSKKNEVKNGEETGRVILNCLVPDYRNGVSEIKFIANTEKINPEDPSSNTYANFIDSSYNVGDTVFLIGELVNARIITVVKSAEKSFGMQARGSVRTEFVNERLVKGGSESGWTEGEEMAFSREDIKEARLKREELISKLGQKDTRTVSNQSVPRVSF